MVKDAMFRPTKSGLFVLFLVCASLSAGALAAPSVTLTAGPIPAVFGQPVTFLATVSGSDASGTVSLVDNGTTLAASRVGPTGQVTISTAMLVSGRRRIRAVYSGATAGVSAQSPVVTIDVNATPARSFASPAAVPAGPASRLMIADVNRDGRPDLISVDASGASIAVALGNGTGFNSQVKWTTGLSGQTVAVGDIDGDGAPDLVFVEPSRIAVAAGRGDGTFDAPKYSPCPATGCSAWYGTGDFNGDGRTDIAFFLPTFIPSIAVMSGNADGTLAAGPTSLLQLGPYAYPAVLKVTDVDGDGRADLLLGAGYVMSGLGAVWTAQGNGDGTFTLRPESIGLLSAPVALTAGDVNGDGNVDVIAAVGRSQQGLVQNPAAIVVAVGNGDGSFQAPLTTPVDGQGWPIAAADFDGDGQTDVAVGGGYLSVLLSNGNGTLRPGGSYAGAVAALAAGEFTGDGRTDIAAGSPDGVLLFSGLPTTAPAALRFVPVTSCRAFDTRKPEGPFGGPGLNGTSRDFQIAGGYLCGIPASAKAYALNLTVVPGGPLGYLTVWPAGRAQPLASTLNSLDGRIKANAAIVPAGTNGAVSVYASAGTHVVGDINGYFVSADDPGGLAFYPVTPCRVADTRLPDGPLGGPIMRADQTRTFPVPASACGIPSSAKAYSLNYTVVPASPLGYLTTWAAGIPQPPVSTLNAPNGLISANAAIVPAGDAGAVSVYTSGTTQVVIDINGYFAPPDNNSGLSFYAMDPCRLVDTRSPNGWLGGPAMWGPRDFPLSSSGCAVPSAQAYSLNATVVPWGPLGYLTLWASGAAMPIASTLNSPDGSIMANAALVPTPGGWLSAFTSNHADLVLDANGYFAP